MERTDLLVIVPHEDDELVIAGPMIYQAVKKHMELKVVFVTNGDYHAHEGVIRMKEAQKSLAALGVNEKDIIFLGYGDQAAGTHLYNGGKEEVLCSHNGNVHTYGLEDTGEFSFQEYGEHHTYTRENYKGDIKAVIRKYHPNVIITTDWDDHMDHVALSLMIDECLGELLKEEEGYQPLVLKGQAYTGKWEGESDYYDNANITLNFNKTFGTENVHPLNRWEDRICFSVPEECITPCLCDNILYRAARAYRSQGADLKALEFINRDIVYWRRHTESLSYRAKIAVSSGEGRYLNDFKCLDCSDIVNNYREYDAGVWIPKADDTEKCVCIQLDKACVITEIHLYENPDSKNNIKNISIDFMDGTRIETGELKHDGSCTRIFLGRGKIGDRIILRITDAEGDAVGLTEIELYEKVRDLMSYEIPLPLWKDNEYKEPEKSNRLKCKLEKLYFAVIKRCRGRVRPNKWMLMQKYAQLREEDSVLKFWMMHMKFVEERILVKVKGK